MLDTYNQQIHNFVSCTIRTNINTANHHFIVMTPINSDGNSARTIKAQYGKNSRANFERQDALGAIGVTDGRYRIRKLTPRECFRLMGVYDADIDKIQAAGISNSQQYKMAGNSIVVDNLYHIFRTMFVDKPTRQLKQLTMF